MTSSHAHPKKIESCPPSFSRLSMTINTPQPSQIIPPNKFIFSRAIEKKISKSPMCPSGRYPLPSAGGESPDFRQAFDVLDADRDGKISLSDLKSTIIADDDVIASMISAADADRNGFVDFDEFERVLGGGGGGRDGREVMEEAFGVMDRDGDGRIGFEDLRMYLEMAGMRVEDEEVRAMVRMGGGDESEGIGFESLVKILALDFAR